MKLRILAAVGLTLLMVSCKKDSVCSCQSVFYQDGTYNGTESNEYLTDSASKCAAYEVQSAVEVTSCSFAE